MRSSAEPYAFHREPILALCSLGIDPLDKGRKDAGLGIGAPRSDQDVVRVPIDREDGGSEGLLQVLRDPPVVLFIERTDGDGPMLSRRVAERRKHAYQQEGTRLCVVK